MKVTATFTKDGQLLTGRAARKAWSEQEVMCACGNFGVAENSVSGTVGNCDAEWLGCDNCTGTALGRPLVYRLPVQIKARQAELEAQHATK